MKNYSFIIPHHNSPELLYRCLDSIPQRDDIEIIVVDDNSDIDKRPQVNRSDVHMIFIDAEHSKGAGRARNYGLREATGKWLVFADCDDFYEKDFIVELDRFLSSEHDVVIWNYYNLYDPEKKTWIENDVNLYMKALRYQPNNQTLQKAVKYSVNEPWNKMIKRSFVLNNNLIYEEVPVGNDAFFSISSVDNAHSVGFIFTRLYYWVKNPKGLTHHKTKDKLLAKLNSSGRANLIKSNAKAWGAICPLHSGIKSNLKSVGFGITIFFYVHRLFNGIPWWRVYYQHWKFVKLAKFILNDRK